MSEPLRMLPEAVRSNADQLSTLSEQARQMQDTLTHTWSRLDSGWQDYAESGIQGCYSEAMNELSLMIAMLEQMGQALVRSADGIEAADKNLVALLDGLAGDQAGGGNGKPPGHGRPVTQGGSQPSFCPPGFTPEVWATIPPEVQAQILASMTVYAGGLTEADLAALQQAQEGNNCAKYAIASALNMLGFGYFSGKSIKDWAIPNPFLSVPIISATTPGQQINILNELAKYNDLPITAEALKVTPSDLKVWLHDPNEVVIVTIGWDDNDIPIITRDSSDASGNPDRPAEGIGWGAHSVVLASYDPTHVDAAGNPAPWGFVNSWTNGGNEIYWMTDADFTQALEYDIPFGVGSNNAVVITKTDTLTGENGTPTPTISPTPPVTATPTVTPTISTTPTK